MTFGEKFKKRRIEMGLTQESFAEKFNEIYHYSFTKSTISNYENNLRTPEMNVLTKLATFMNVSIDYLLGIDQKNETINNENEDYRIAFDDIGKDYAELEDSEKDMIKTMIKAFKDKHQKK